MIFLSSNSSKSSDSLAAAAVRTAAVAVAAAAASLAAAAAVRAPVSDVTFGNFPVYKRFRHMGKNTQKVDKGEQPAPVAASSQ